MPVTSKNNMLPTVPTKEPLGLHQRQVAALVSDKKLDRFKSDYTFPQNHQAFSETSAPDQEFAPSHRTMGTLVPDET